MSGKKTPLYDVHIAAGAKVIEFGGWLMPVQYSGIIEEHKAVRTAAGLFDVSHMGEVSVTGADGLKFLNYLLTNDLSRLAVNQALYSPMCYPDGGVVDDLLVYRLGVQDYLLVINAGNIDKDVAWIEEQARGFDVVIKHLSDSVAELALQGPKANEILQGLVDFDVHEIKYYWLRQEVNVGGITCLLSRTGYTGEDGFELYCSSDKAVKLWEVLMTHGKPFGLVPAGLGARDTLRFEATLPLYGHELTADITPLEAGLSMFVKLDKENFIGHNALLKQKNEGLRRKIVGIEMVGRGIARAGYPCIIDGRQVGVVTSGSYAPSLNKNLGLALLDISYGEPGTGIGVEIRDKIVDAITVKKPFYKRGK